MIFALATHEINNPPAGLIARSTLLQAQSPELIIDSVQIGVDTGLNLSVAGSLATILWLTAIRREGERVFFSVPRGGWSGDTADATGRAWCAIADRRVTDRIKSAGGDSQRLLLQVKRSSDG
jgi:hypothetical protein